MRPTTLATIAAALVLTLAGPACGSTSGTTGGATDQRGGSPTAGGGGGGPETGAAARRGGGQIALRRIGNFDQPVHVTGAPGFPRLLFVVEQSGRVMAMRGGRKLRRPFLDIRGRVSFEGERGLLSIAFPPDYRRSKRFYVYYTDNSGAIRIDEFQRRGPTRAAPGTRRAVIRIPHAENTNHNGGQAAFLGDLLYFGPGDGGSSGDPPNNAQNRNSLLGKLLRIDPRPSRGRPYTIPRSNPFVGRPGRPEIFSYGLRNPYRFSFDTVSAERARIAIADVGQNRFEELDYLTVRRARGANFGWDAFEGFSKFTEEGGDTPDPGGTVKPIYVYSHDRGGSCSVTGGHVVAKRGLRSLYKRYVYADFCEGELRSLVPGLRRARDERRLGVSVEAPSSFGEDQRRNLYVASLEGPVYRIVER